MNFSEFHFGDLLEVRANGARTGEIAGYASTFGGEPDSYGDVIAPGAFSKSIAAHKAAGTSPAMLWGHDTRQPIGKWLDLTEDRSGLKIAGKLTLGVPRARDAHALASDGALSLSIGYVTKEATRDARGNRLLKAVDLHEVSLVAIPANTSARIVSVKSAADFDVSEITDIRAFESFLREAGFSRALAKGIAAHGFKSAAGLRDADDSDELRAAFDAAKTAIAAFTKG